ncbi:hypothetical protein D9757_010704 [Collybiopsis confluens]|uniref:Retrovirus-related Pol polyprotein from transposon TNT 1-94-like beta-barrel domain-containing protein n=1 Tax=Collybiopsis confluens TaxID=2823264 RepID=A0A8H5H9N5_9AGAR|nr:hypothetical protein D9757_010704 [Collybiopsis confluens]
MKPIKNVFDQRYHSDPHVQRCQLGVLMKAYLRLQGVWRITSGDYTIPARTTSTNAAGVTVDSTSEEVKKEIRDWQRYDDMAQGAIQMRLPNNIARVIMDDTSKETWDTIKAQYGTTGSAGKFAIFRQAISFTIFDNTNPTTPIANLMGLFSRLDELQVDFSDAIQAMIILAALPPSWDSFCATMLAGTAGLSPALLIPSISDEYRHRQSGSNGKKQRNEGASNNGQQTSNDASGSGQSNKHKTRRGKGKGGKGKGKPGVHAHASEVDAINSASANNAIPVASFATAHFTTIPAETKAAMTTKVDTDLAKTNGLDYLFKKEGNKFIEGSSKDVNNPILVNIKQEEQEIDLAIDFNQFYDTYLVNSKGEDLNDEDMEEVYGSGDEKLIFWQVAFAKLRRTLSNQMHRTKQMFNKLCNMRIPSGNKTHLFTHSIFTDIVFNLNSVNSMIHSILYPIDSDNISDLRNVHGETSENANGEKLFLVNWLLDSGASDHFTPFLKDFAEYHEFDTPMSVETADKNSKVQILGYGTVIITHDNGLGSVQTTKLSLPTTLHT